MCVRVCVCLHVRTHACVCVFVFVCIRGMNACMHAQTHARMLVCACLPAACLPLGKAARTRQGLLWHILHTRIPHIPRSVPLSRMSRSNQPPFVSCRCVAWTTPRRPTRQEVAVMPLPRLAFRYPCTSCVCVCVWLCVWRWFVVDGLGFGVRGAGFRVEGSEAVGRPRALLLLRLATKR